eukprot:COSAG01_NODE_21001_length_923_cov_0.759709_1_plen_242_part_00
MRNDSGRREQTEIREVKHKLQALAEEKDQVQAQLAGAEALAQGQREVATEVRKMLESHKQTSDEQVKELRQTIEELEEELVTTADERDAYQSRLSDTSEREAANCTIAQLKQQLLVSKAEVQQLRQASVDKDTKIAQLRTQANAHATVAVAVAAPSSGLSESASGTPCRAADQLQHSRTLANAAENETTITNGAPTPKGASRRPSGRMGESAHIQRLRRARRNTMDRDSFSKGAPIAFFFE